MNNEINKKIAHLGFIQGVISRMGNNSFLVKGWVLTLVVAILAVLAQSDREYRFEIVFILLLPIVMFWLLNGYYLYQERLFRCLYNKVTSNQVSSEEFTLDTKVLRVESPIIYFFWAVFSPTLFFYYFTLIVFTLIFYKFYIF